MSVKRSAVLLLLLLWAFMWNLSIGAVDLKWSALFDTASISFQVMWELRLPRAVQALLSGLLLALTGAVAQTLFRNPLADPSLIGVSAGSALGAVTLLSLGGSFIGLTTQLLPYAVPLVSFVGGLLTTLLILTLASRYQGVAMTGILLVGMAVNAIATAWIGAMKYFADDQGLRDASFWLLGHFGQTQGWQMGVLAITTLLVVIPLLGKAQTLNIWLLGQQAARHLGVDVDRLRWQLIFISSLGVAVVVSFAGLIGFVGLMVPHIVRLWSGPDHRQLLPESALVGAIMLLVADAVSRLVLAPSELPVGVLTALAGGPFFLLLIHLRYRETGHA